MWRSLRLLVRVGILTVVVSVSLRLVVRATTAAVADLVYAAQAPSAAREWSLARLDGDLAAALLLVAATGLAVLVGLAMAGAATAGHAPLVAAGCCRVTPRVCRRLVAAALGLGLASPMLVDGSASAVDHGQLPTCRVSCRADQAHGSLVGLGFPDLPSTATTPPPPEPAARQVVVRNGDSLWRIAERRLPPTASSGEVAALTWKALRPGNRPPDQGDDPGT